MRLNVLDNKYLILDELGVNKSWSLLGTPIKIKTHNVEGFYPARINLEYAVDQQDNITLYKNRMWHSYMDPTKLDKKIPSETDIDRELLESGEVPFVRELNEKILDMLSEFAEIRRPDDLTEDNFKDSIEYLMNLIDDRQTYLSFLNSNKLLENKETVEITKQQLELLGSAYMLYSAKRRTFRG